MFQKVIGGVFWENIVAQWVYCGIFWDIIDNLGKLYWMNHDFLLMIIPKWSKLFSESLFLFCITFRWWNMLTEISSFEWEGCSHSNLHFYSKVFHGFPFNGDLTVHNGVLIELIWMAHLMVISWRLFLKRAHPSSFFRQANNPELFKNQVLGSLKTPIGGLSNWNKLEFFSRPLNDQKKVLRSCGHSSSLDSDLDLGQDWGDCMGYNFL